MKTKYSADGVVSLLIILISLLMQACSPPAQSAGVMQTEDNKNRRQVDLIIEGDSVAGIVTEEGLQFRAPTVVLTVGTFLGGRILTSSKDVE